MAALKDLTAAIQTGDKAGKKVLECQVYQNVMMDRINE